MAPLLAATTVPPCVLRNRGKIDNCPPPLLGLRPSARVLWFLSDELTSKCSGKKRLMEAVIARAGQCGAPLQFLAHCVKSSEGGDDDLHFSRWSNGNDGFCEGA